MVKPIPEGYHGITPHLIVRGVGQAIEFYKKAFGAKELMRMPSPDGRVMHAEIEIGGGKVFMCDEFPEMGGNCSSPQKLGGSAVTLNLYVENTDAVFNRAVAAGAKAVMPPADMFWGDRYAKLTDPFGHEWALATHKEDVPPGELAKRAATCFQQG